MNVSFIGKSLIYVSTFILFVFIIAFCLEMWDFLNSRKSHNFKDIMNIATTSFYGFLIGGLLIWFAEHFMK